MKTLCSKINNFIKRLATQSEKRRTLSLVDGTTITKPFSYNAIIIAVFLIVFIYFFNLIIIDYFNREGFIPFITRIPNFFSIIGYMVENANLSYFSFVVAPLMDTIKISIAGTIIGSVVALPFAVLASENIMGKTHIPKVLKPILSIFRTFPTLVYATIFTFIFGFGSFAGVLATIIFTFSIVAKMMYEIIETVDMGPFIAIEAAGATKIQAFRAALIPQIIGRYYSVILYNFEINLRASAILGFVNAGGIGKILNDEMSAATPTPLFIFHYGNVFTIVLTLLIVIIVVQNISQYLRQRLT